VAAAVYPLPAVVRRKRFIGEQMKRLRKPKIKDGQLMVYWGKLPHDNPDIIFSWQGDASMKRDSAALRYYLGCKRPDPHVQPIFSKMLPSMLEDLEDRGYDITTLRFSIMKKQVDA
jgi:hypothetical protein